MRGTQFVVENDQIGALFFPLGGELHRLAGADEVLRGGRRKPLDRRSDHIRARAFGKLPQFGQRIVNAGFILPSLLEGHQKSAFADVAMRENHEEKSG